MNDDEVRRHIAGEVRAEVSRQAKPAGSAAALLRKSKQAYSRQWRGDADYRPQELVALAKWLGVDVRQFLPSGYVLMMVGPADRAEMAS